MKLRLTYAMDKDNVFTTELETANSDFDQAYKSSIEYIEKEHGTMQLIALSILLLEEVEHAN